MYRSLLILCARLQILVNDIIAFLLPRLAAFFLNINTNIFLNINLQRVKIEEEETKQLLDFSIWTLRRSEAWDKKKKSGGSPRLKIGSADLGCELLKHVPRQAYASRLETRAGTRKSRVISLSSDLKPSKILLNETKRLCLRHPLSLFLSLSFRAITIWSERGGDGIEFTAREVSRAFASEPNIIAGVHHVFADSPRNLSLRLRSIYIYISTKLLISQNRRMKETQPFVYVLFVKYFD